MSAHLLTAGEREYRSLVGKINRILAKRPESLKIIRSRGRNAEFRKISIEPRSYGFVIDFNVDVQGLAVELGIIKVSQGRPASPEAAAIEIAATK